MPVYYKIKLRALAINGIQEEPALIELGMSWNYIAFNFQRSECLRCNIIFLGDLWKVISVPKFLKDMWSQFLSFEKNNS